MICWSWEHFIIRKWTKIATILGLSRATLYRRLVEAGVSSDDYTQVSDEQLDEVICSIKQDHPNDGEVLLQGHLLRQGIKVPRHALRNAIHRVDHISTVTRKRSVVRRRIYSVPCPNYIWHIDGHYKLIRWRFVIHGAVDGFSHTITYVPQVCRQQSGNNSTWFVLQGSFKI